MKKLVLLLSVVSLSFSCSSDDDPNYSATDLVGTWTQTSSTENGVEGIEEGDCLSELIFTKTTVAYKEYYGDNCESVDEDQPQLYSVNGKIVKVIGEENESDETVEILELTSKRLKFKSVYEDDGEVYTYIETYTKN